MKIGRNQPCPCGSGKKYKKCCLSKSVTPNKTLQYQRLANEYDKLLPRLIEYGVSVFGEGSIEVAMHEFVGWPEEEEDTLDEAAIERAETLFWPWYVFNWEYEGPDADEPRLNGPEDTTIAELYIEDKNITPDSITGRLLLSGNRVPYSFLEILSLTPDGSVALKDVLTGAKTIAQEQIGVTDRNNGDILFGRVTAVDGIGIFNGVSAIVLPARMKPELIRMRRSLAGGRKWLTHEDIYDWDIDIRRVFLDIDRALHTMPRLVNTDGEPLQPHKLIYDIDGAETAVRKLADLSAIDTLDEIIDAAEKDNHGTIKRAQLDWSRENTAAGDGSGTILGHIEIGRKRLTVSVNSANRAQAIREEIDRRMGATARFLLDEISDMEALLRQAAQSDDYPSRAEKELVAAPEVREHMTQMLGAHWEKWVDEKIPVLGNRTPRQAVKTADGRESVEALLADAEKLAGKDALRSSVEMKMIADVRRRLKIDNPPNRKQPTVDPEQLAARIEQVRSKIIVFGSSRLHETYTEYALRLCSAIAASSNLNLHRGRPEIWAAAIVYAIAQLNFLFDPSTPNHLTTDEVAAWFDVKKPTVSGKAGMIRETLELFHDDMRFCAPHITRIFEVYEDGDGFLHPAMTMDSETAEPITPIPLKPSTSKDAVPARNVQRRERPPDNTEDKQLSLFSD